MFSPYASDKCSACPKEQEGYFGRPRQRHARLCRERRLHNHRIPGRRCSHRAPEGCHQQHQRTSLASSEILEIDYCNTIPHWPTPIWLPRATAPWAHCPRRTWCGEGRRRQGRSYAAPAAQQPACLNLENYLNPGQKTLQLYSCTAVPGS